MKMGAVPTPALQNVMEPLYRKSSIENSPLSGSSELLEPTFLAKPARVKQIWAVGGGKGGVGKSLVASSLAIALSRIAKRVVAIDLDLGGANLHTTLGVDLPKQTLSDYLTKRVIGIEKCIVPTGIPRLEFISGAHDAVGIANLQSTLKYKFLSEIRQIDADYVIFDLGAGTSFNTLDFFIFSDIGLITLLPEPTSIENAYRFIKSAYFRYLSHCPALREIRPIISMAMDPKNPKGIKSPADLFKEVTLNHPDLIPRLKRQIEHFSPNLVVNQTRTQADEDIGSSVKTVCKKYFGINMDYIGHLDYDSAVWQSIRKKRPLMIEFPNSTIVSSIERIVEDLIKRHGNERNGILLT
ncbi:MAG: P-loop NTPase [Bdellovibrionia bacterium]